MSLNPTKISGVCGRLMCCLQYEQNAYEDMLAKMPKRGDKVETPDGVGVVADTATLKGQIKVRFQDESGENVRFETYVLGDFNPLNKGARVRLERPEETIEEPEYEEVQVEPEVTEEVVEEKTEQNPEQKTRNNRNRNRRRRGGKKPQLSEKNEQNKHADNQPKPDNGQNGGYSNGYQE